MTLHRRQQKARLRGLFCCEGEALHAIQRGNNREPILAVEENYRW
jgi:hypothetical protein